MEIVAMIGAGAGGGAPGGTVGYDSRGRHGTAEQPEWREGGGNPASRDTPVGLAFLLAVGFAMAGMFLLHLPPVLAIFNGILLSGVSVVLLRRIV